MLSATAAGRRMRENVFLKLPLVGRVYESGLLARLAEAMAVLTAAGCTLPLTVRLAGQSSRSELMKRDCELLAGQLEQGEGLLEGGMGCRIIPRLFLYATQLATQRNELYDSLTNLGQMYAQQTIARQGRTRALLMPILIIFIGGVVGSVVLALFLPMVTMIQVLM
jgi:type IV pilus assembly protein PilC